jgi:hypothetical protein
MSLCSRFLNFDSVFQGLVSNFELLLTPVFDQYPELLTYILILILRHEVFYELLRGGALD